MYFLLNMVIFHCYVSLPEGKTKFKKNAKKNGKKLPQPFKNKHRRGEKLREQNRKDIDNDEYYSAVALVEEKDLKVREQHVVE